MGADVDYQFGSMERQIEVRWTRSAPAQRRAETAASFLRSEFLRIGDIAG